MQYQSFPGVRGDSCSFEKLKALRLPSLGGKRFLDVGCNEGFFCGYALHAGAAAAMGIDRSHEATVRAQERFPAATFLCQSWDTLPEGSFDVILLASALHYANDQAALIDRLMAALTDDGVLVLELGIAPSGKKEWVSVARSIDERLFPSRSQLQEVLADYAWKIIGHSCEQAGDPIPRYVVHIRKLRPAVFLLTSQPASGKSTLCRTAFANSNMPVVSGDTVLGRIARGQLVAPQPLHQLVSASYESTAIAKLTDEIFTAGLGETLFDIWCAMAGGGQFVLDAYLTDEQEQAFKGYLTERGYLPVTLSWQMDVSMANQLDAQQRAEAYQHYLEQAEPPESLRCFKVTPPPAQQGGQELSHWHLDSPRQGQAVTDTVTVSGWVMPRDHAQLDRVRGYIKSTKKDTNHREFSLTQQRADVLASLQLTAQQCAAPCGFRFSVAKADLGDGVELGVLVDGHAVPLAHISEGKPQAVADSRSMPVRWQRWVKRWVKQR